MSIDNNDLVFDPVAHTYHYKGVKSPGVTTVLEPWNGLQFVDPEILAAAAEFGTHVHDACDMHNRGELDEATLMDESPLVWEYLQGWKLFLRQTGVTVVESECRVVNAKLGYAGTLDTIVVGLGKERGKVIIDIKTGTAVPKTVGPQVEAYNQAYKLMHGGRLMKRFCCHLTAHKYNLVPLTNPRDWDIFKAALILHKWSTGE